MPIKVFRFRHLGPEDLNDKYEESFRECDILFLENPNPKSYKKNKRTYQRISDGKPTPDYSSVDFPILFGSKKRIELEKSKGNEDAPKEFDLALMQFYTGKLEASCRLFVKGTKKLEKETIERDNGIPLQLKNLQRHNKGKKILARFGASHTFYYDLKREGLDITQEFPNDKPFIFSLSDELSRRIRFNKKYDRTFVARAIGSVSAFDFFTNHFGYSLSEATKATRKIFEKLSYEDINDLSKYIMSRRYTLSQEESTALWLQRKGFI